MWSSEASRGDQRRGSRSRIGTCRLERSPRTISLLVGLRPTKALMGSRAERLSGHTGTETLPRLLREAAVENHSQCAKA